MGTGGEAAAEADSKDDVIMATEEPKPRSADGK